MKKTDEVTGGLVAAEAAHLRGIDIGQARADQIARDIRGIVEATAADRDRLDFNDEPARFDACLHSFARATRASK